VLAVGEQLLPRWSIDYVRVGTGFAGGVGESQQEMCGALSGGLILIGALYGRTGLSESDQPAVRLASQYRRRFLEQFGHTQCGRLREEVVYRPGGVGSCGKLVERAAAILLELLAECE
jgi:C_GCAxxG_C_C family probable redox protein